MFKKINKNNKPFKVTASNGPLSLINRANVLFFDTFTDTDGVTLNNHTPDIDTVTGGAGWDGFNAADFEIISGEATNKVTSAGNLRCPARMIGYNNHHVSCTIRWAAAAGNTERTSVRCRDNFEVGPRAAGDFFFILEAGTLRSSTAVTLSDDTNYPVTANANGATITGTINGGNTISYNLAGLTGNEVGLFTVFPNTAVRTHFYNNFKVERVM